MFTLAPPPHPALNRWENQALGDVVTFWKPVSKWQSQDFWLQTLCSWYLVSTRAACGVLSGTGWGCWGLVFCPVNKRRIGQEKEGILEAQTCPSVFLLWGNRAVFNYQGQVSPLAGWGQRGEVGQGWCWQPYWLDSAGKHQHTFPQTDFRRAQPQRHRSWGWRKSLELGRGLPPHQEDGWTQPDSGCGR